MIDSLELRGEGFDDARNLVRTAHKSAIDWKAFYGIASPAESYVRRDGGFHLHLSYRANSARSEITGLGAAARQREHVPDLCVWAQLHPHIWASASGKTGYLHASHSSGGNRDEAMFVHPVQLVHKKKGAAPTPIPSLVWLKRLDACPEPPIDALNRSDFSVSPDLTSSLAPLHSQHRKSSEIEWIGGAKESELPSESIERRTKIVGDLPNDGGPLIGEALRPTDYAKTVMASLLIEVGYANFIGVVFEKPLLGLVQQHELAFCPLDLGSWPVKWVAHDGSIAQPLASQSEIDSNVP